MLLAACTEARHDRHWHTLFFSSLSHVGQYVQVGRKADLWSSDRKQVPVLVLSVHSTSDASLRLQPRPLVAAADG